MVPLRLAAPLAALLALAACRFDWTVGAAAEDARADATASDGGGEDAAADAGTDAPAFVDCGALAEDLQRKLADAKRCTSSTTACEATAQDECGCVMVLGADDPAKNAYVQAVAAFVDAGCPPVNCSPSQCPSMRTMLCIADLDGGTSCSQ